MIKTYSIINTVILAKCLSSYLVVLFDDVLCSQSVVLQIMGQVEHVLGKLLLQVVVVLQDSLQLCSRLTLINRETSAQGGTA